MPAELPGQVAEFRTRYRADMIGPSYSGWVHFAATSLGALAVIIFAATRLSHVRTVEWLAVPASFLIANVAEYLAHRGPMHHPRRGLAILYQRHTQQHHHFYTRDAMAAESPRDFKMVLFPPVMLWFFLGALASPIAAILYATTTANVAFLFVVVAVGYFLTYEWLHLAYHAPATSWVHHLPGMGALRRHHTLHHDLALMSRWNFNVTFPIADHLFRTAYRPHRASDARPPRADPAA